MLAGSERVRSKTAVTRCLTVAPPVVAIMFSLENASLKQMTRQRASTSPLQTVLVVTRRVRLCSSRTCTTCIRSYYYYCPLTLPPLCWPPSTSTWSPPRTWLPCYPGPGLLSVSGSLGGINLLFCCLSSRSPEENGNFRHFSCSLTCFPPGPRDTGFGWKDRPEECWSWTSQHF